MTGPWRIASWERKWHRYRFHPQCSRLPIQLRIRAPEPRREGRRSVVRLLRPTPRCRHDRHGAAPNSSILRAKTRYWKSDLDTTALGSISTSGMDLQRDRDWFVSVRLPHAPQIPAPRALRCNWIERRDVARQRTPADFRSATRSGRNECLGIRLGDSLARHRAGGAAPAYPQEPPEAGATSPPR